MNKDQIFQTLKDIVLSVLSHIDQGEVVAEGSLRDLGANSIDRIDIIMQTMETIGVMVPMVAFGQIKNMQGIVDLLHEKLHAS